MWNRGSLAEAKEMSDANEICWQENIIYYPTNIPSTLPRLLVKSTLHLSCHVMIFFSRCFIFFSNNYPSECKGQWNCKNIAIDPIYLQNFMISQWFIGDLYFSCIK